MSAPKVEALHELLEELEHTGGVAGPKVRRYLEALEDRYLRLLRNTVRFGATIGLGVLLAFIGFGFQVRSLEAAKRRIDETARIARAKADRNSNAIRVGCTLLSNAIIQSGSATAAGEQPRPSTQQKLNSLLIGSIVRGLPAADRERAQRLLRQLRREGGPLTLPSCDDVAAHPERVKALGGTRP